MLVRLATAVIALCVWSGVSSAQTRATVYVNANIYTMDSARPRAPAMAVQDGRVLAVGPEAEVRAAAGDGTARVDLGGQTVLPGLIDCHGHMSNLGALKLGTLDLTQTKSFEEVVAAVAKRVAGARPGEWILGRGWDHESWSRRELPTHDELSRAAPDNPVWLRRVDGHASLANRRAMDAARIGRATPNPSGGEIIRNQAGEATGVFVDRAAGLIDSVVPSSVRADPEALILKAQELCLSAGLTGVHDAGVSPEVIAVYQRLEREGRLKIRVNAMVAAAFARSWFEANPPFTGTRLTVRSAKLYMDGAMGSRGAWLLAAYADRPTDGEGKPYVGLAVAEPSMIESAANHALEHGYQVCTHAIGDRANREVLDGYERALRAAPAEKSRDARLRLEHAQLLSPQDIGRLAALGVIASMQPTHCTSDMRWVEARVGAERARGAYAWRSLLRSGAHLALGSDFPVESHNPFLGFYAAVTRQNVEGQPEGGWLPSERMTREETLRGFTADAAYASFEENARGVLAPGRAADFVVIDRDVMACDSREIPDTKVLRTVIDGEMVYSAEGVAPAQSEQPEKPPSYVAIEVTFPGAGGLELKGTLLEPGLIDGPPLAAVVLLPGSGPTDRDGNQRPGLVTDLLKQIAEQLSESRIATLRFDKRATQGYREKWPQTPEAMSDFFSYENFVGDAAGAVAYLRARHEIDPKRVGMIGHSEGGLLALQVAHDLAATDRPLAAIVLMGTAGRTLGPVVREQIGAALKAQLADEATTKMYVDATDKAIESITRDAKVPEDIPPGLIALFNPSAARLMQSYFTVDPAELAAALGGPVLIVQGEKDVQVSAERDTPRLKEALEKRGKGSLEVLIVPGASHNLKAVTGPQDPGFTGSVAGGAIDKVEAWLKEMFGR